MRAGPLPLTRGSQFKKCSVPVAKKNKQPFISTGHSIQGQTNNMTKVQQDIVRPTSFCHTWRRQNRSCFDLSKQVLFQPYGVPTGSLPGPLVAPTLRGPCFPSEPLTTTLAAGYDSAAVFHRVCSLPAVNSLTEPNCFVDSVHHGYCEPLGIS